MKKILLALFIIPLFYAGQSNAENNVIDIIKDVTILNIGLRSAEEHVDETVSTLKNMTCNKDDTPADIRRKKKRRVKWACEYKNTHYAEEYQILNVFWLNDKIHGINHKSAITENVFSKQDTKSYIQNIGKKLKAAGPSGNQVQFEEHTYPNSKGGETYIGRVSSRIEATCPDGITPTFYTFNVSLSLSTDEKGQQKNFIDTSININGLKHCQ